MMSDDIKDDVDNIDLVDMQRGLNADNSIPSTAIILLVLFILIVVGLVSGYFLYLVFGTDSLIDHSGDIYGSLTCEAADPIDATDAPCCSQSDFIVSGIRYLSDIVMTIGVNPVQYQTVCRGYCSKYTGNGCDNPTDTKNYQDCIAQLQPMNCNGLAMPVARVGNQKYYGQAGGYQAMRSCNTQCKCGLQTCVPPDDS
jgi:hypothetical protein